VQVVKNYDNSRFYGQAKALGIVIDHPLGFGARNFVISGAFPEDVHNVYISMFLNAGWGGGLVYIYILLFTIIYGFKFCFADTPWRGLYLVTYASFVGIVIEGIIVDSDHWRHFFALIGLLWGMMITKDPTQMEPSARNRPQDVFAK
jgi:O-antigen ligase